jgi:hypothetical protein
MDRLLAPGRGAAPQYPRKFAVLLQGRRAASNRRPWLACHPPLRRRATLELTDRCAPTTSMRSGAGAGSPKPRSTSSTHASPRQRGQRSSWNTGLPVRTATSSLPESPCRGPNPQRARLATRQMNLVSVSPRGFRPAESRDASAASDRCRPPALFTRRLSEERVGGGHGRRFRFRVMA